eukprot:g15828.t1
MSGHTAEALGPLVLQIGGMRKSLRANDVVHVTVLNLRERRIFQPTLHPESLKPLQRMRHASCVVCVFGGDVPTFEDEYERIQDRTCCFFVYVLELASCTWSAVKTTGSAPDWRSFHAAVGHTSFLDGKDYLITFGGTAEHCEPLAGGHLADMRGYQLDLHDFKWLGGPTENLPAPRLRFGAARYGRHLLIHGGHGGVLTSGNGYVARMNLHTLTLGFERLAHQDSGWLRRLTSSPSAGATSLSPQALVPTHALGPPQLLQRGTPPGGWRL